MGVCLVFFEEDWSEEQDVYIDLKLIFCYEMVLILIKLFI